MAPAQNARDDEHHARQMEQLGKTEAYYVQRDSQVAGLVDGFVDL